MACNEINEWFDLPSTLVIDAPLRINCNNMADPLMYPPTLNLVITLQMIMGM